MSPSMVSAPEPKLSREIFRFEGQKDGPNVIFIGGMHGNEPSGIQALNNIANTLAPLVPQLKGNAFGLIGNIAALQKKERYISEDLNRIWQNWRVNQILEDQLPTELQTSEAAELKELWSDILQLMDTQSGPFIFIDLHTTSVNTVPFITMSDTIMNRQIAKNIPVPVVIGIEEYLDEPLLSFVNEMGCVSFAFEAGQHTDPVSVENHEALIWMLLVQTRLLKKSDVSDYSSSKTVLKKNAKGNHKIYEIRMRQGLDASDKFKMKSGFENFQAIQKGEILATLNGTSLKSVENGLIFMPLYQAKGSDGYFTIKKIAKFWLGISFVFRKFNFHQILLALPGVSKFNSSKHIVAVDSNIAKWYSKEILHLMGYRRKKRSGDQYLFLRRKYDLKGPR